MNQVYCSRPCGLLLAMVVVMTMAIPGQAHVPERTRQPVASHDGFVKQAGPYNIEFVREGRCVSLYVNSKSNAPLNTSRSSATTTVYTGGEKHEVALKPDGKNRLRGCGEVLFDEATMLIIRMRMYGKEEVSVLMSLTEESA